MTHVDAATLRSTVLSGTLVGTLALLSATTAVPADDSAQAQAASRSEWGPTEDLRVGSSAASPQWQTVDVRLVAELDGPFTSALSVQGDNVYAGGGQSLAIVDASDTSDPWLIGLSRELGYYPFRSAAARSHVGVTTVEGSFRVFDVRDRYVPREVAHVDLAGEVRELAWAGEYAYLAVEGGGLLVIDMTDPASPRAVGSVGTPAGAGAVAVAGDLAYVTAGSSGLRLIDVDDPRAPHEIGAVSTPGFAMDVAVIGSLAYVTYIHDSWDQGGGMLVIDASDPTAPREIGSCDIRATGSASLEVAVEGKYAFVEARAAGLRVIDVSDPRKPVDVGGYYSSQYLTQVVAHRGYVFAAGPCGPLLILQIGPSVGSSVYLPIAPLGRSPVEPERPAEFLAGSESGFTADAAEKDLAGWPRAVSGARGSRR